MPCSLAICPVFLVYIFPAPGWSMPCSLMICSVFLVDIFLVPWWSVLSDSCWSVPCSLLIFSLFPVVFSCFFFICSLFLVDLVPVTSWSVYCSLLICSLFLADLLPVPCWSVTCSLLICFLFLPCCMFPVPRSISLPTWTTGSKRVCCCQHEDSSESHDLTPTHTSHPTHLTPSRPTHPPRCRKLILATLLPPPHPRCATTNDRNWDNRDRKSKKKFVFSSNTLTFCFELLLLYYHLKLNKSFYS